VTEEKRVEFEEGQSTSSIKFDYGEITREKEKSPPQGRAKRFKSYKFTHYC